MVTSWSLTAQEICTDALEHIGAVASGETPSAEDMNLSLRGLDAVLKELPLYGYNWPKLSGETALSWSSGQTVNLPTDYYAYPVVWKTSSGQRAGLKAITHANWEQTPDRYTATGEPTHFYISPANVLYFYPTPTTNPGAYIQYQKVVDDASLTVTPDVLQTWENALGYGVANEIGLKFQVAQPERVEISQRWAEKRERALQGAIGAGHVEFTVDD